MDQDEMLKILEEIARNGSNRSAQIQAIRTLREWQDGVAPAEEGFAKLYDIAPGARKKAA